MVQIEEKSLPLAQALSWGLIQPLLWFLLTLALMALLFLIGHNLGSVENWMYIHSWEILLGVKFLSIWVWKRWKGIKVSSLFKSSFAASKNPDLYIVCLYFFIASSVIFLSGEIVSLRKLLTLEGFIAVLAKLAFYLTDFLVLTSLFSHLKLSSIYKRVILVLISCLSCIISHSLILSVSHSVDFYYLANLLFSFSMVFILGYTQLTGIIFHCIISVPLNLSTLHLNEPYAPWVELTHYITELEYFSLLFFLLISFILLFKSLLSPNLK